MRGIAPVRNRVLAITTLLLAALLSLPARSDWVADFYAAEREEDRRAILDSLDLSSFSFEELHRALSGPPRRERPVATGLVTGHTVDERGERFPYSLMVPPTYDAAEPHPVVVLLHGTVSRKKPRRSRARQSIDEELIIENVIQVFPSSWTEAKWWTPAQSDNLERILARLKASYNVDTNKVFLVGISDGATGGFYQSATNPSAFAGFVSVIGYPGVLKGSRVYLKENVYPINLRALRILAFNTEKDALYPVDKMQFYVDAFREIGVDIEMVADPRGGHDVNALKRALPGIWRFVGATRRAAYPDAITWQYESGSRQHRVNWLLIHELVPHAERDTSLDQLPGMQPTDGYTGMIELRKQDNAVVVNNHGVASYSLLFSPDHFDFDRAISVIENGTLIFQDTIKPRKKVLLDYAARDFDPARLYGAELTVEN